MGGGPSQYESFDPKPGHECMRPSKTIALDQFISSDDPRLLVTPVMTALAAWG
jgi:hypothetical protein